jgi:hypothetical protein
VTDEPRHVFKYLLAGSDWADIELPVGAKLLSVQAQNDLPMAWFLVRPSLEFETRRFRIFCTGESIPDELNVEFAATFQILGGDLIFHVFEEIACPK